MKDTHFPFNSIWIPDGFDFLLLDFRSWRHIELHIDTSSNKKTDGIKKDPSFQCKLQEKGLK